MFHHVVQRLLGDAIEGNVYFVWEVGRWTSIHHDCDRDARPSGHRLGELPQQIAEVGLDQRRWPQFQEQGAHLGQRAAGEPAQLAEHLLAFGLVGLP